MTYDRNASAFCKSMDSNAHLRRDTTLYTQSVSHTLNMLAKDFCLIISSKESTTHFLISKHFW